MFERRFSPLLVLGLIGAAGCASDLHEDPEGVGEASRGQTLTFERPAPGVYEATLPELSHALKTGALTPEKLVRKYFDRIGAYEERLNAFSAFDGTATEQARALRWVPPHARGPLHGIPIVLKDNIDVAGLPTTGGTLALAQSTATSDAFITKKLRRAGAVILGKSTLTELANFMTLGMPGGYSSLGGFGFNPYDPRTDPRPGPFSDGRPALSPSGSSSGSAIAVSANFAAAGVGTDTSGSLLSPAIANGIVALRPTTGLVSRSGILPITSDADTAGPMGRTVTDVAIMLGVLAGHDPADPATEACLTPGNCYSDYRPFLRERALRGARIAVPRFYWQGLPPDVQAELTKAIDVLRAEGATVDDRELDGPAPPELMFPTCLPPAIPITPGCSTAFLYGFKRDINRYLGGLAAGSIHSLADLRAFNEANAASALRYGQLVLDAADQLDTSADSADTARYQADRAQEEPMLRGALEGAFNGPDGIAGNADDYDVILFASTRGANITARAGYPAIVVPTGFVANLVNPPFPPEFTPKPAPFGVFLTGRRFREPRLLSLAYAFEQATKARRAPALDPLVPPSPAGNTMDPNQSLAPGQKLTSPDGRFTLVYEDDGNLVLYKGTRRRWTTRTGDTQPGFVYLQGDGNFVVYDAMHSAVWHAGTHGHPGSRLVLQNDGNLVVYGSNGRPLWSSHTRD